MSLKFKCPKCDSEKLECCEDGPYISEITNIDDEGDFDYGPIEGSGSTVDGFQCAQCGYVLQDKEGNNLDMNKEVVEWIKKHCEQPEEYIDPRYLDDNTDK